MAFSPTKFKTDNPTNLSNYKKRLQEADITKVFNDISTATLDHTDPSLHNVNELVDKFSSTLILAASETLEMPQNYNHNNQNTKTSHKWFNKDCRTQQRRLRQSLRKFNNNHDCRNSKSNYFISRKSYRQTLRNSKRAFIRNLNEKIESGKIIDWKHFKTLKTTREPPNSLKNEDLEAFADFFEKLYKKENNQQNSSNNNIPHGKLRY